MAEIKTLGSFCIYLKCKIICQGKLLETKDMFERQIAHQMKKQRTRLDRQNHAAKKAGYLKVQGRKARQMKKRFDMFSGTHARRNSPSAKRYPGGI